MPGLFIRSCKLYQLSYRVYTFWWNCLEFIDKMDLTTQMRIFNNEEHRHAVCLKFGARIFTSMTMFGLEEKASICSTIKENLILCCRKFLAFVVTVIN